MTLILTEISHFGIAIAADSAITEGTDIKRSLSGIQKLQPIPKINAGISCWGEAEIGGITTDIWLDSFIKDKKREYTSIEEFALLLQNELRKNIDEIDPSNENLMWGTIGFHLAGFVKYEGEFVPTCYHIHNGRSQMLERRGEKIDPKIINANHDFTPNLIKKWLAGGVNPTLRNGEIEIYATIFDSLQEFFNELYEKTHIKIPQSNSLEDRAEWLKFQIEMIGGLYKLSNIGPSIGGEISTLTISEEGIQRFVCINPYFKN